MTRSTPARIQALGNALDDAALAGRVAAFEQNHHLAAGMLHPVLQFDQFALQTEQLAEIEAAGFALVGIASDHRFIFQRVQRTVFHFKFHLFVIAVRDIQTDAADDFLFGEVHDDIPCDFAENP